MAVYLNSPNLYFSYLDKDGNWIKRGPYYNASPSIRSVCGTNGEMQYEVQNENLEFVKIIVPFNHIISAMNPPKEVEVEQ